MYRPAKTVFTACLQAMLYLHLFTTRYPMTLSDSKIREQKKQLLLNKLLQNRALSKDRGSVAAARIGLV